MREIQVDIDVFAAIWSHREPGEGTENAILRRIFLIDLPTQRPVSAISPLGQNSLFEEKSSKKFDGVPAQGRIEIGKIRWVDDVRAALTILGGKASLEAIYKIVKERRSTSGRSVPRTLDAVIRRTLEDHSSDSANFRGDDLFRLVSRGEWALR